MKPPLAPKGNPRARSAYVLSAYPGEEAVAAGTVIANVHSEGVTSPTPRSVEDNTRTMLRILLIEDHPHLAEELRTTLEELVDAHIVATAAAEAERPAARCRAPARRPRGSVNPRRRAARRCSAD